MSAAIAACGAVYLAGALLLFAAIVFFARRDVNPVRDAGKPAAYDDLAE
jgi:hypothetical protein